MMPGVTASRTPRPSAVVLPDPTHVADFVNDVYTVDGSPVDLGDVVDAATGLVDSEGLFLEAGQQPVAMAGAFYDRMATFDWSVVFEIDCNPDFGDIIWTFYTLYAMPGFGYENYIHLAMYWLEDANNDYPCEPVGFGTGMNRYAEFYPLGGFTQGIHKIGFTRTDGKIAVSIDGSVTSKDDSSTFNLCVDNAPLSDTQMFLGAFEYSTIDQSQHVKSMKIFDAVEDDVLRALTT